ncbi:bifunctional epoxide hydrolase 2 [Trichosurus vulpecula]|uniref:bifunctional epoxide hydrolase 2 n=1 Tax=Trichosurus vulpecula TaxID=9337 RepID=UPI00186B4AEE|nr:bifunctional epoxide hydrolase 2 [Trichosurus vulpecula]
MGLRAALFDVGGVLLRPSPNVIFRQAEEVAALPSGFLNKVVTQEGLDNPYQCLIRGKITFLQWVSLVEEDCRKLSAASGFCLPEQFSIRKIYEDVISKGKINYPVLQAAITLRKKGYKTCIITNNWLDDSSQRDTFAQLLQTLRKHFDLIIESCQIGMAKPDPEIYKFALEALKVEPHEAVFLDDTGANLKKAREIGMVTILVQDIDTALKELEKSTGIQLLNDVVVQPIAIKPSDVAHGYVEVKPGVQLHFVEMGSGPVVILCHGFPESWFSWRYQIPALAEAGYRVIVPAMKGYDGSSGPHEIEEYSMEVMCKEFTTFLDKLGISQAVFIGHDWGGALVWYMALFYPERVRAVGSLNTPFAQVDPAVPSIERIKANPRFHYQLYFQEPGVAEAELGKDLTRTFKIMFRASDETQYMTMGNPIETGILQKNTNPEFSRMVTEEEIEVYVQQFKKSGFRGPLNWYRNMDANWKWSCAGVRRKILIPALMVTAEKDKVLLPKYSERMEMWIPNLKRRHIENCGHWTQMEKPREVNQILIEWLQDVVKNPSLVSML